MICRFIRLAALIAALAWIAIAADITGTWEFKVQTPRRNGSPSFTFKQDGEKLGGTYSGLFGKAPLTGTVKGDQVEFSFKARFVGAVQYTGTIEGPTSMKGNVEYGNLGKGTFTGTKK
jgi:hypothetical protein